MIFNLIIGLIFYVFVILQIFFDGWFESQNTGKMMILENFGNFENFVFFSRYWLWICTTCIKTLQIINSNNQNKKKCQIWVFFTFLGKISFFAYILLIYGQIWKFRFHEYFAVFRRYLLIIVDNSLNFFIFFNKISFKRHLNKKSKNLKIKFP